MQAAVIDNCSGYRGNNGVRQDGVISVNIIGAEGGCLEKPPFLHSAFYVSACLVCGVATVYLVTSLVVWLFPPIV